MCDSYVVMGSYTKDGSVIFGKNSDRDSNEPQLVLRQPRMKHDVSATPTVKLTYIEIPQVEETYEIVVSKPSWMWGGEMAFNEFGLVIGNEAVFTKEENGPPALTGMDMVRLAAERCKNADEALEYIVMLLGKYGQGGNCGYQSPFQYHNGFLISDAQKAWILETAGKFWAAKKVENYGVISNGLSIRSDFDKCHPQLIQNAIEKGYCKSKEGFDFTRAYAKDIYKNFTKYKKRRCLAGDFIEQAKGEFDLNTARDLLRMHNPKQEGKEFKTGSMKSVCMHGGGAISSQTTSSLLARLHKGKMEYRITASSVPCISLFKPFWMESTYPCWSEDKQEDAIAYWRKREDVHRMVLAGRIDVEEHHKNLKKYEEQIEANIAGINPDTAQPGDYTKVIETCFALDEEFIENAWQSAKPDTGKHTAGGNLIFKAYWKKTNRNIDKGHME